MQFGVCSWWVVVGCWLTVSENVAALCFALRLGVGALRWRVCDLGRRWVVIGSLRWGLLVVRGILGMLWG